MTLTTARRVTNATVNALPQQTKMKNELLPGFTWRAPTPDDAQAVTDFLAVCDTFDYGEPDYSLEDVRADWRRDGFQLERDAWLIFAKDGTLAAYGFIWDTGERARVEP
ncbi:MAG: hypothetical protein B6D41_16205, partial [Chloroflexi bacterium UTCFX4]